MINVTKTYLPDKKKYLSYVDRIYKNGWVTNNGELVQELTNKLEEYLNVKNLILVSNGTSALEVAYRVLKLDGDVITTPFSFVATTSSLVSNNLNPVYADIDCNSLNINPKNIEKIVGKKSAVVATHVFGNPCEINEIESIAKNNNLKVVYDAAHCFSVNYKGKSILSYGDISTISFHATKLFHTIEGGAIVVNDDSLIEDVKNRINFGIDGYDSVRSLGTNAKMNEFEAAMGLCVLDDMSYILEMRENVFDYYTRQLKNYVDFQCFNLDGTRNFAYFPVLFKNEVECLKVQGTLNGIGVYPRRYFYPSLDTLPYVEKKEEMLVSRDTASRILSLPMYAGLSMGNQKEIVNAIKNSVG